MSKVSSVSGMRLIEFHPGEGSRFLVAAAPLLEADVRGIGGTDKTILVTFGEENRTLARLFERDPGRHPFLEFSYVEEKLGRGRSGEGGLGPAALIVAHHVIAHLLGREATGGGWTPDHRAYSWTPDQLDWSPDWREQLQPLIDALDAEPQREEPIVRSRRLSWLRILEDEMVIALDRIERIKVDQIDFPRVDNPKVNDESHWAPFWCVEAYLIGRKVEEQSITLAAFPDLEGEKAEEKASRCYDMLCSLLPGEVLDMGLDVVSVAMAEMREMREMREMNAQEEGKEMPHA